MNKYVSESRLRNDWNTADIRDVNENVKWHFWRNFKEIRADAVRSCPACDKHNRQPQRQERNLSLKVSSTNITVSLHCCSAVLSISFAVFSSGPCGYVCGMLHMFVLFSLSLLSPPLTSSSLCVGWEVEPRGARRRWQVVGRSRLTDAFCLLASVFVPVLCVDVYSVNYVCNSFSHPTVNGTWHTATSKPQPPCVRSVAPSVFWSPLPFPSVCLLHAACKRQLNREHVSRSLQTVLMLV